MIQLLKDAAFAGSIAALALFVMWDANFRPRFAVGILAGAIMGVVVGWLTRLIRRALRR
jgi:hypothetical protein